MPETAFKRAQRVGQMLQQELGDLLVNEVKDPRVGFVTVTEVRPSDDLRTARVYVSIYGNDEVRQETLTGLQEAAGYLKRQLGQRIKLRFTPSLTFVLDTTLDNAERLDKLLAEAKGDSTAGDPEAGTAAEPAAIVPVHTSRSGLAEQAEELQAKKPSKTSQRRAGAGKRRGGRRGRSTKRRR